MTAADNDTSTTDIINRLRDSLRPVNPPLLRNADIAAAANEIERLRERCEGYKGQIEAGAIAIEHLRANRAVAAPPGWKLVPEEPTEAMVAEGGRSGGFDGYWCEDHTKEIYRAMLDYAPPPPCSPDSKSALVISKERIKTTVGLVLAKNKWPIHQTYDDAGLDYEEYEEFVGEVLALLLPSGSPPSPVNDKAKDAGPPHKHGLRGPHW